MTSLTWTTVSTLLNGWTTPTGYGPLQYGLTDQNSLWVTGTIAANSATNSTFFSLPTGFVPAVAGGAAVGASAGVPSGKTPAMQWSTTGTLTINNAGSFSQATTYFIDANIPMPNATAPTGTQPTGPGGNWTLEFYDEFSGTSLDTTRWVSLNGYAINGTSCLGAATNVTVSGGYLYLTVASATSGAYISSSPSDGAGANGWDLPVGGCVEARMYIPGTSSTLPYNWGGYFCSGQDWPDNGEIDICETNGSGIDVNYHYEDDGEQQTGPYNPSGNWCNSWHTYTAVRGTNTVTFYWDGTVVKEWSTDDEGGAMSILPCNGTGGGGPAAYGIGNAIMVDYVRGWVPATGGGGLAYRATPAVSQSSGAVTSFTVSNQGAESGDWILIYLFGADGGTPACTGFTVATVDNENIGTLLYKQATGSEGSSFNITGLGGAAVTAIIATVSGGASSIVVGSPNNAGGSYNSFGVSGITMPSGGGWVLAFAGNEAGFGGAGYAITAPSGYTSRVTNGAQSGNATMMLADNESVSAGATGTQTFTSTSAGYWTGVLVALQA